MLEATQPHGVIYVGEHMDVVESFHVLDSARHDSVALPPPSAFHDDQRKQMASTVLAIESWQPPDDLGLRMQFFDGVIAEYCANDEIGRAYLRSEVKTNSRARNALLPGDATRAKAASYLSEAARRAKNDGAVETYVRNALCVISLTDGFGDSHDTLVYLVKLWHEAEKLGIDPSRHYLEIGDISSDQCEQTTGSSTKFMMHQVLTQKGRDELIP